MLSIFGVCCSICTGQPAISAHAGLILFTEGAVSLDGKPYIPMNGRFSEVPEDVTLETQDGKADVLLAPGVFLRVGTHTGIRLVSNKLVDVQVEFLSGSAIVESTNPRPENSISLFHHRQRIRIGDKGRYRIDSEPAQIAVHNGQLEIRRDGTVSILEEHQLFSFDSGDVKEIPAFPLDSLDYWDQERQRLDIPDSPGGKAKPTEGWKKRLARLLEILPLGGPRS